MVKMWYEHYIFEMLLTVTSMCECLILLQTKFLYLMVNILKMKNTWVWTTSNIEVEWFAQHHTGTVADYIGSIHSQVHLLSSFFKEEGKMQSHVASLDFHIFNCSSLLLGSWVYSWGIHYKLIITFFHLFWLLSSILTPPWNKKQAHLRH